MKFKASVNNVNIKNNEYKQLAKLILWKLQNIFEIKENLNVKRCHASIERMCKYIYLAYWGLNSGFARLVLYHLGPTPSPIFALFFREGIVFLSLVDLRWQFSYHIARITGTHYYPSLLR
jgi:hypothetical protein